MHLINVKRLAYETKPFVAVDAVDAVDGGQAVRGRKGQQQTGNRPSARPTVRPAVYDEEIRHAVEAFLAERRAAKRR